MVNVNESKEFGERVFTAGIEFMDYQRANLRFQTLSDHAEL